MQLEYGRLNPTSEMVALTSWGNTKNLVITPAEIVGPLDVDALKQAVAAAVVDFPQLGCSLKEVEDGGKKHLAWEPRPELPFPVSLWDIQGGDGSVPLIDSLLGCLEPAIERDRNLFEELPGEFHIVRRSTDHHVVVPLIHHVAADAAEASEFGRRVALRYRELVTGERLELRHRARALSTDMKNMTSRKRPTVRDALASLRRSVAAWARRPVLPAGSGDPGDTREYHIKRLFSVEETKRILEWTAGADVRLSDLMVVCGNISIDRWNELRNVRPGIVTTAMTVNMKGRYRGLKEPNSTSVVFFKSVAEDRQEPTENIRTVAAARTRHFTRQLDLRLSGNLAKMLDLVRRLPFKARRRVVHHLVNNQQFSMTVTMLGVVWPAHGPDRERGASFPTRIGDALISEVHGIGYKLLSSTPIVFIVYIFRHRLNIVMAAAGSLFSREEAERFADTFLAVLREYTAR